MSKYGFGRVWFDKDGGADLGNVADGNPFDPGASGTGTGSAGTGTSSGTDGTGNALRGTCQNNGTPPTGSTTFISDVEFQKKVDELLKDCLKREKKETEEVTRKTVAIAQAEAAKKNSEWQKVAETKEHEIEEAVKKLAELDAINSKANEFETALLKPLESL